MKNITKKPKVSVLKKKLDKIFSIFIRLRDSNNGYGTCITCGANKHWKEAHAGHFVGRKVSATRFDERNVHLQCCGCNTFNEGRKATYGKEIIKRYGKNVFDELATLENTYHKFTPTELQEKIDYYSKLNG